LLRLLSRPADQSHRMGHQQVARMSGASTVATLLRTTARRDIREYVRSGGDPGYRAGASARWNCAADGAHPGYAWFDQYPQLNL
jgi:hypothetical protein